MYMSADAVSPSTSGFHEVSDFKGAPAPSAHALVAINSERRVVPSSLKLERLPDMEATQVTDGVWLSGKYVALDDKFLRHNNIGGVINLASSDDVPSQFGFVRYLDCFLYDADSPGDHSNILLCVPPALAFIRSVLKDGKGVLVHCNEGRSRGPALVLAYLICEKRMPLAVALKFLQNKRKRVSPNHGFVRSLIELETKELGRATLKPADYPPPLILAPSP